MPNEDLNGFLAGNAQLAPAEEASSPAPEPQTDAPADAPAPAPEAEDPDPSTLSQDGRTVPLSALQGERRQRQDYKERWAREEEQRKALETERDTLRRELEEARKAPPPAVPAVQPQPPAQIAPPPNPAQDPDGYSAYTQQLMFNERLNMSEAMIRQQHGDADVDAKLAVFKKAVEANPALRAELSRQAHPYRWAYEQAQRIQAMDEIGTDPTAYKSKLEAEIRAKLEAEMALAAPAAPAPVAPVPNIPGSIATARSAAPRNAPTFTGPVPLDQLFPQR